MNTATPARGSRTTARLLVAVVILQALTLVGQWTGQPSVASEARADVPDPAARQLQMVEQLRGVNERLDKLVTLFESGKMQVRVEAEEK